MGHCFGDLARNASFCLIAPGLIWCLLTFVVGSVAFLFPLQHDGGAVPQDHAGRAAHARELDEVIRSKATDDGTFAIAYALLQLAKAARGDEGRPTVGNRDTATN
jgi:hypothetical protein